MKKIISAETKVIGLHGTKVKLNGRSTMNKKKATQQSGLEKEISAST
jgi:hypothetical protein